MENAWTAMVMGLAILLATMASVVDRLRWWIMPI